MISRKLFALAVALPVVMPGSPALPAAPSIAVRTNELRQSIDGFGASSAWYADELGKLQKAHRDKLIDIFFDPETGAGLSILRLRVDPSGFDAESGRYDWSTDTHAAQLDWVRAVEKAHDVTVFGSPWTPPKDFKDNDDVKHGGRLELDHYDDYAAYLASWVEGLAEHGIEVDVLSLQNEPGKKRWESCQWTYEQFRDFLAKHLGPKFAEKGLQTKLLAAEWTGWDDKWINRLLADPATRQYVDMAGSHLYWGGFENIRPFPQVKEAGIPLWMTEHFFEGETEDEIHGALINAKQVHETLTVAEVNAYLYWWMVSRHKEKNNCLVRFQDFDAAAPQYKVSKRLWAMGHFARFVRPGWRRVVVSEPTPAEQLYASAYLAADGGELAVVVINMGTEARSLEVRVEGGSTPAGLTPWRTSATEDMAKLAPLKPAADGAFGLELPPRSMVTLSNASDAAAAKTALAFSHELARARGRRRRELFPAMAAATRRSDFQDRVRQYARTMEELASDGIEHLRPEGMGLIERCSLTGGRRTTHLRLTAAGRQWAEDLVAEEYGCDGDEEIDWANVEFEPVHLPDDSSEGGDRKAR